MRLLALVVLALTVASGASAAPWRRAASGPFVVYARANDETIRQRLNDLRTFDLLLQRLTGIKPAPDLPPLPVYFVSGGDMTTLGMDPSYVGGFYRATSGGIVAVVSGVRAGSSSLPTLFHEYTHHFMLQHTRSTYPKWYGEGFASYLETAEIAPSYVDFAIAGRESGYVLNGFSWAPMRDVLTGGKALNEVNMFSFYAQSWLAVHYLLRDGGKSGTVRTYLMAINRGVAPETAFKTAFGMDYAAFDTALRVYKNSRSLVKLRTDMPPQTAAASAVVTVLPDIMDKLLIPSVQLAATDFAPVKPFKPDADATPIEKTQARRSYDAEATARVRLLSLVRRETGAAPTDPAAAAIRAEAELKLGDRDAGLKLLEPLLAAAPRDGPLLYLRGAGLLAAADSANDPGAARKQARLWLARANRATPDDFRILASHAATFAPTEFNDGEVDVLMRAATLAPQVSEIQTQAAIVLAGRGRRDEAKALLMPIANNPHGGTEATEAAALIASIEKAPAPAPPSALAPPSAPATPKPTAH